MPQERLDLLKLPKDVRNSVNGLVRALNAASTKADVEREGALEIALILGLEQSRKLKPADIEALYMIFDDAKEARLQALQS
ncbi:hypothetical protein [Pseudomonas rhizosphaerae]|jgi:hypothetical protein|uniref:Uncharacterized protein n=1 Tax=Pseudomonas rhizosphaerae TaxID=216142 RepID=A0A089YNX1_9PSED|nr:hypothetical protein [Pseudomonas rhizosphaerae]AIS18148.1 hypothetical protein LT40_12425 [Pseudomonas rhizosphaerae]MBD8613812.1 hypothetical protein [Pseudomonas putida]MEB2870289.1 hypothetical protein [Pseudomonas rhizosphaerae]